MTAVSVAVMADRRRAWMVDELVGRIDGRVTVVWDRWQSKWDTGRRALLSYNPDAAWHVVVQDDAVVCDGFRATVETAVERVPGECPVGLYFGAGKPLQSQAQRLVDRAWQVQASWIVWARSPMWGVALAIPTRHVRRVVAWGDRQRTSSYDSRVRGWFIRREIPMWHPFPSLVDHRNGPENPQLATGRHSDGRVAHWFDCDAATDWTGPAVHG